MRKALMFMIAAVTVAASYEVLELVANAGELVLAMPMIAVRTTMAANGSASPLNGSQWEIMQWPGLVEFAVLADTGASVNGTVYSGSDVLMEAALLQILAVASPIVYPDHYVLNDIAAPNERLKVTLQETAAGTPIVRTNVRITPV